MEEKIHIRLLFHIQVKSDSQKDMASQLLKKHFEIKTKEVFAEFSTEWDWKEENYACKRITSSRLL